MKEIRTEDAVGHVLCHDITQIIKDEKKGVLFKKGHIVREEDIPALLSVGKKHLDALGKTGGYSSRKMKRQKFSTVYPLIFICTAVISKKERSN